MSTFRKTRFTQTAALLASVACLLAADLSKPQTRTLTWEDTNPQPLALIGFNIYSSTNIALALDQWPLMTNLFATNLAVKAAGGTNTFSFTFPQIPQLQYFAVRTVDLYYGAESDFSNVTNTPAPAHSSRNLTVH